MTPEMVEDKKGNMVERMVPANLPFVLTNLPVGTSSKRTLVGLVTHQRPQRRLRYDGCRPKVGFDDAHCVATFKIQKGQDPSDDVLPSHAMFTVTFKV